MKLAIQIPYAEDFLTHARRVVELERAGLDVVLIPEGYAFDAASQIGYLAAITERIEIGAAILNVYSRSAALLGMTAAGCDYLSGGRFFLGLGASGPQVVEGFHGVPYRRPVTRIRETIEVVRTVVRREVLDYAGETIQAPLASTQSTGLGKPLKLISRPIRPAVPIWWAALKPGAVRSAAALADGWIPFLFVPELADRVWGHALRAGLGERPAELGPLSIVAGAKVAIGDNLDVTALRDRARPFLALAIGGMGPRGGNHYNDVVAGYGFEDAARTVQDLFLDGKTTAAESAIPDKLLEALTLIGPRSYISERLAAAREVGVTHLTFDPLEDPVMTTRALRELID